jgi:hypothetical protein
MFPMVNDRRGTPPGSCVILHYFLLHGLVRVRESAATPGELTLTGKIMVFRLTELMPNSPKVGMTFATRRISERLTVRRT